MSRQHIEATLSLSKQQICMHCIPSHSQYDICIYDCNLYSIFLHVSFSLPYFLFESRSVPHHMKSQPSIVSCYTLYTHTAHYFPFICNSNLQFFNFLLRTIYLLINTFQFFLFGSLLVCSFKFIFLASEGVHQWLATRLVTLVQFL